MLNKKRKLFLFLILASMTFLIIFLVQTHLTKKPYLTNNLKEKIDYSLSIAHDQLKNTVDYLNKGNFYKNPYPSYTYNPSWQEQIKTFYQINKPSKGAWVTEKSTSWIAGFFPSLLWKMYSYETDNNLKQFWLDMAKAWSEPLRTNTSDKFRDITINNLFVFQPWFENSAGQERQEQLETILQGARILAKPWQNEQGNYQKDLKVMGYKKIASRTDKKEYWQVFIDHTINVEQLLWASVHNPNLSEANQWQKIAIEHIQTIGKTFGKNRHPGTAGTWQRGYFDDNPNSPNSTKFLFNEGKQGWKDSSTWSRGQAWVIYGASTVYNYTKNPGVLSVAKDAINYFLDHLPDKFPDQLRRVDDFMPPWDFDYALEKNPDTERDSSAAAIAVSGMVKLLAVLPDIDPDKQRYLDYLENILDQLTSAAYLTSPSSGEMSILKHGCYHHYDSISPSPVADNGTIWGDYFFVDALMNYKKLRE